MPKKENKTVQILVTDEEGVILDSTKVEVSVNCRKVAFRPIEGSAAERPDEQTLEI